VATKNRYVALEGLVFDSNIMLSASIMLKKTNETNEFGKPNTELCQAEEIAEQLTVLLISQMSVELSLAAVKSLI
jgi:hypothetical protein